MNNFQKLLLLFVFIISLPVILIIIANKTIELTARNRTFNEINAIPKHKTGLLLGTSQYFRDGRQNLYFLYRIQAAVELFEHGKVDILLVSGDNSKIYYNEPVAMKKALVQRGIPEDRIYLDYAGFRTLDSVVRAKKIFGQESFVVISQKFHNERAIYLAKHNGINAIGYNAQDVKSLLGLKTRIREIFARVKVFLDIIMNIGPKYLGEPIEIL